MRASGRHNLTTRNLSNLALAYGFVGPTRLGKLTLSLSTQDYATLIPEFADIYSRRPIVRNQGGMGLNHCFALFAVLRTLRPPLVIESGVFKGQSTWLIEAAVPEAGLFCFDPNPDFREYISLSATYSTEDFAAFDWSGIDTAEAVCFFDDHQSAYARLMEMRWWGFKRAVFEDNFPVGQGDSYSLRHVFAGSGHPRIQMSPAYRPRRPVRKAVRAVEELVLQRFHNRQHVVRRPNLVDQRAVQKNLGEYFELPAVALNPSSNWGDPWHGAYKVTTPPLLEDWQQSPPIRSLLEPLSAAEVQEELKYGYIAYVELAGSDAS